MRVRARCEQGEAWQGAMAYLSARLQSTSEEVAGVAGHEARKPDMGVAAAEALLALQPERLERPEKPVKPVKLQAASFGDALHRSLPTRANDAVL